MPEISVRSGWLNEIVSVRARRGLPRYLIAVHKERCPACPTGTLTRSVWVTLSGVGEEVCWCAHCFNATCRSVDLCSEHMERLASLRAAVGHPPPPPRWDAVRPALEDLERRGLL